MIVSFHKEGAKIILISCMIVVAGILVAETVFPNIYLRKGIQSFLLIFLILILQFFRNPNRSLIPTLDTITAPVDGKVVVIEEVYEPEIFKSNRLQVSIFMSPINVHVTRYPIGGKITHSIYHPGKYLVAWHPKASTENERTTVVIENEVLGEIMYRQIAGALAKRIVNYAKEGQMVLQGSDAGFIKFGSRVDLFLPPGTPVQVKIGDVVKGNRTVIFKK